MPSKNLRDNFRQEAPEETPPISLSALAQSLGVTVNRLVSLAQYGYLQPISPEQVISSTTLVKSPPAAAILWLRSWFVEPQAKPLLTREDLAGILNLPIREVLPLAAMHNIPTTYDEALGWLFSMWAARQMLLKVMAGREGNPTRFDRQALLWFLLEDDPDRACSPPTYSEMTERELARAAALDEPARSIRTQELLTAMRDAEKLAASVKPSASTPT